MDGNEEQRKRLGRSERRPESRDSEGRGRDSDGYSRSYGEDRSTPGDRGREKGTIDRLIDQAQEKGYFDKAERFFRDRFGGGKGGSPRR